MLVKFSSRDIVGGQRNDKQNYHLAFQTIKPVKSAHTANGNFNGNIRHKYGHQNSLDSLLIREKHEYEKER